MDPYGTEKKVIFVGGTSFSGSTLLHFMLANDRAGIAVGEIRWLFYPAACYHINRPCACGDKECRFYEALYKEGARRVFLAIFERYPEVQFIVDSSKHPYWIHSQANILRQQQISVTNALIWKNPWDFYRSMQKRGRSKQWAQRWVHYHRLYFSLFKDFYALSYTKLATSPQALQKLCAHAGVPYYPEKREFWRRKTHAFGGNRTARYHFLNQPEAERVLSETHDPNRMDRYRSVRYVETITNEVREIVDRAFRETRYMREIYEDLQRLESRPSGERTMMTPLYGPAMLLLFKTKYRIKTKIYSPYVRCRCSIRSKEMKEV